MFIVGCARPAPELPTSGGSQHGQTQTIVNDLTNCDQITAEISDIDREYERLEGIIHESRGTNQAAGYFGAFLLLPLAAIEGHTEEIAALDELQSRKDGLLVAKSNARC